MPQRYGQGVSRLLVDAEDIEPENTLTIQLPEGVKVLIKTDHMLGKHLHPRLHTHHHPPGLTNVQAQTD